MPLWASQIRAAVHSTVLRPTFRPTECLHQWHNLRLRDRSYTTALAERRQDEPVQSASRTRQLNIKSSGYLDFVLEGYAPPRQPSISRVSGTGPTTTIRSRKGLRRARGKAEHVREGDALPTNPLLRARVIARIKALKTGRREKPRLVSIRSDLRTSAVYSSAWSLGYAALVRRYDKGLPEHHSKRGELDMCAEAIGWTKEVLDKLASDTHTTFSLTDIARKSDKLEREVWSEVALYLLRYDKLRLMEFLTATNVRLYPPINWVEDCLQALARHYSAASNLDEDRKKHRFHKLIETFVGLIDRETREQFVFSGGFVTLLLPYCTDPQVNELWAVIKLQKVKVAGHTLLHFADYFGKHSQIERSLDALLEAKAAGIDVRSVAFRKGCSTLLRRSCAHPDGLRVCLRLIEHLVSIGIQLSTRIYNIIILNAVEAGDLETAHTLYRSMREQGFKPNAYTSAIRLKACKLDIDNVEMLGSVIQDAVTFGNIRKNSVVSSEILHCLVLHHTKHNPTTAFQTLAAAYAQFYDPSPLERLGLRLPAIPSPADQDLAGARKPASASTWAIGYLLWVYLDHNASSQEALNLYNRWRELVEAGDNALAPCAATPHISNIFLNRFTRSKSTLLQAAQVVKDMQRSLPEAAGVKQAEPDAYTWSIFGHGFARRGEMKLAEQVFVYMRKRGMEPNHIHWTSLIGGYASSQDAEGLMDAIRRAEQSGDVWDGWTNTSIDRFRNKQKLKELLDKQRFERSLDFSSELKDSLGKRIVDKPGEHGEIFGTTVGAQSKESLVHGDAEGFRDSAADRADHIGANSADS